MVHPGVLSVPGCVKSWPESLAVDERVVSILRQVEPPTLDEENQREREFVMRDVGEGDRITLSRLKPHAVQKSPVQAPIEAGENAQKPLDMRLHVEFFHVPPAAPCA